MIYNYSIGEIWGEKAQDFTGDFGLTFAEFVDPLNTDDGSAFTKPLNMRLAAAHLHIGALRRSTTFTDQQLDQVIVLDEGDLDGVYAHYLALLTDLFPQVPACMATKELGFVETIQERSQGEWVAHVFPVTLHLAGPMYDAYTWYEDLFTQLLLISRAPKKPHNCRQQRKEALHG